MSWEPPTAGARHARVRAREPDGHGLRATFGLVSSTGRSFRGPRGRRIVGSIEHTAPLPRGSSGGPLVDQRREPARPQRGPARGRVDPRDPCRRADRGSTRSRAARGSEPRLGVALAHPRAARKLRAAVGLPERDGLLVRAVVEGSPAAAAGLAQGDLLTAAAGSRCGRSTTCSTRSTAGAGAHGAARHRGARGHRSLQFVKSWARMRGRCLTPIAQSAGPRRSSAGSGRC